jgi:hypothetical protein
MQIDIISQAEYDIYTAICQEKNLFSFDRADTIFNNLTGDCPLRLYHQNEPRFFGGFKYKCKIRTGMIEDYEAKNASEWQLEKKFQVENGYRFLSELNVEEFQQRRRAFTLSRVGFSESGDYGLVHIAYSSCGYYLLLHHNGENWQRTIHTMSYSFSLGHEV